MTPDQLNDIAEVTSAYPSTSKLIELLYSPKNSGRFYSSEKCWKTYFTDFYNDLLEWDFPDDFKFGQKVYHYINNDRDLLLGVCPECGKRCKFKFLTEGYLMFCSRECKNKSTLVLDKVKSTCLQKYGASYYNQTSEFKHKARQTKLDKYGDENFNNREKYKETCLDVYGCEHSFQSDDIKERMKETCLDRYGCEHPSQNKEIKEKQKQTCLERYGKESYTQTIEYGEKTRQTSYERYGCEHPSQNKEIQEKQKKTCLERYGKESYFQTDEYRQKYKDAEFIERLKKTNNMSFGADWYFQSDEFKRKFDNYEWVRSKSEKCYQTKKKNNTFNTSKIEEMIAENLETKGIDFIRQYKSDLYPFNCDFYFPNNDLYVEIQGSWTHGPHPFTGSDDDIDLLEKWKSRNTEYYDNAVDVWVVRDVEKRRVAKQNNINYLEIFSCDLDECVDVIMNRLSS